MNDLLLKSLHLIFVVTWFAGLFYIVRLYIYHTEAAALDSSEGTILKKQFTIMERRLWLGITWPSCVLAALFGTSLIVSDPSLLQDEWLQLKLVLIFLLFLYHLSCGYLRKLMLAENYRYSSTQLRLWNEVATVFLVAIIFLAVTKETLSPLKALGGFLLLSLVLTGGIYLYRAIRKGK